MSKSKTRPTNGGRATLVFLRGVPVEREIISRYNCPVFYPPPLPQKDVDTGSNGKDRNGINGSADCGIQKTKDGQPATWWMNKAN
jgi:hypothetical protein